MSKTTYINQTIRDGAAEVHELDGAFYVMANTSYSSKRKTFTTRRAAEDWACKVHQALEDSYLRLVDALFTVAGND